MGRRASLPRRNPLIALLTDFGLSDPYVGQMKGVLALRAPAVPVIDLTHGVPPQDVRCGRFFLEQSLPFFPDGTIFVCVVDPGVGTSRKILWARTDRHQFLAPDNGLLAGLPIRQCREVNNPALRLPKASSTFHGRDIFAPAAAALATGFDPKKLGPDRIPPNDTRRPEGIVVFVDRFGNAVTDLPASSVPAGARLKLGSKEFGPLRRAYGDVEKGKPLALIGSFGTLEFAVRDGDFAKRFRVRPGSRAAFIRKRR